MNDSVLTVASFSRYLEITVVIQVKMYVHIDERSYIGRAFLDEDAYCLFITETCAARSVSSKWRLGVSSVDIAAAIPPWASQELDISTLSL
jgi:hypothetical protein